MPTFEEWYKAEYGDEPFADNDTEELKMFQQAQREAFDAAVELVIKYLTE